MTFHLSCKEIKYPAEIFVLAFVYSGVGKFAPVFAGNILYEIFLPEVKFNFTKVRFLKLVVFTFTTISVRLDVPNSPWLPLDFLRQQACFWSPISGQQPESDVTLHFIERFEVENHF